MMSLKRYIGLALACGALVVSACKKQEVDIPHTNDPVFCASGELDGQQFELVAGDDNAFMHTMVLEENGVHVFTGNLSDGNLGIEINIFDGLIDMPHNNAIGSLPLDSMVYARTSSSALAVLSKDQFPNSAMIQEVEWFVDGDFVGVNYHQIMEPGRYEVCAKVTFMDATDSELCSELILGYSRNANCQIKHYLNQNGVLNAWIEEQGVTVEKVRWFIENDLVSEDLTMTTSDLSADHHRIRAEVSFSNGVVRWKNMIVDGSLSGKYIDDLTFFETATLNLMNKDFNVRLRAHENGMTYDSEFTNNDMSTMTIDNIAYYGPDANGNPVYKITATVDGKVSDSQGLSVKNLSFQAVFGLALPKE